MSRTSTLPITDAAKTLRAFITRMFHYGWGPRDSLAGKRESIEILPGTLAQWGTRRRKKASQGIDCPPRSVGVDRRTWQRALRRLVDQGKVEIVGRGPRGSYLVRPIGVPHGSAPPAPGGEQASVSRSDLRRVLASIGAWPESPKGGETPQSRRSHAAVTPQSRRSQIPDNGKAEKALPANFHLTLDSGLNDSGLGVVPQLDQTLASVTDSALAKDRILSTQEIQERLRSAGIETRGMRERAHHQDRKRPETGLDRTKATLRRMAERRGIVLPGLDPSMEVSTSEHQNASRAQIGVPGTSDQGRVEIDAPAASVGGD